MTTHKVLILVFIFLVPFVMIAQPHFPDDGVVFDDSEVPRVDILINPDTLEWIYENVDSYLEWHATFIFQRDDYLDTVENIGFRLRGNTSRYSAKKSFKVSFNTFEQGRKWNGLEKLNLNGEHNDPSIMRSKLSWDLLRALNIPAPRSNHIRLYINGNFHGVYINVEHIDEEFADSRFNNQDGNLYKCLYPADLAYKGSNPDLYKEEVYGRRAYELKTNTGIDDYSDLANFIDQLNNTSTSSFFCSMDEILNVFDYAKIAAVDVFIGNWDGYIYNKNNFYLYFNTEFEKFEYIPYDLDNTFGIDWMNRDWATRDIYDWQQHGSEIRPLYTRIMDNDDLRGIYSNYMNQIISEKMDPDVLFARIDSLKNMIAPFVEIDPYYPLDYGYTIDDFYNSFEEAIGAHVKYGIKPYILARRQSALEQLELEETKPVIKYIRGNYPLPDQEIWIRAQVEAAHPLQTVKVEYSIDGSSIQFAVMYDDGEHQDDDPEDQVYGAFLPGISMNSSLSWQIFAMDEFGNAQGLPCEPVTVVFEPSQEPALFINEFMAANDAVIEDEYGDYDDWIEIYNGDDSPVWMGDKYLTDNLSNPDKWLFPDVTLQPGEFLLLWADEQQEQGIFHTNFKLDKEGEEIGLFDSEATAYFPLDTIIFGQQDSNIPFGRQLDGGLPWMQLNTPTPGASNMTGGINHNPFQSAFGVYPNPVINGWLYLEKLTSLTIYNTHGQRIKKASKVSKIDTKGMKKGLYLLITEEGQTSKFIIP
ncbi:MAG: CotH kinase family protein [Bacteroidetes bacterium]|nr:CotH kinase family protein [Bacteroidota bacterium]